MKFLLYFLFSCLLLLLLVFLFLILSSYESLSQDKGSSAFECGFDSITPTGVPFSMPFFIISLMFFTFDVEILLVCFYPLFSSFTFYMFYYIWFVLLLVLMATIFEWYKGIWSWL
uniref:NADH-ubiquinone oxidoreductase chain 3 n=1 Tax=Tyrophagus longior TaxID=223634 RepID=A0A0S2SXD2_TYRLO|nr:NADH dehydrogenase subunit 3 [Tyrophagus longior]ALP46618.1 NADH dehydrogenase subunit 3 [Tyrophagus longior]